MNCLIREMMLSAGVLLLGALPLEASTLLHVSLLTSKRDNRGSLLYIILLCGGAGIRLRAARSCTSLYQGVAIVLRA